MKKAFTLAEVMIVLTVIGVLTAILLPVAKQSLPDENLMKFKKAHNTLGTVIRELVTSDKYYLDGDLGVKPNSDLIDGTHEGDNTYFCNTFADIVNVKNSNCNPNIGDNGHCSVYTKTTPTTHEEEANLVVTSEMLLNAKNTLDIECKSDLGRVMGKQIVFNDDVVFYEAFNKCPFGKLIDNKRTHGSSYDATVKDINGLGVGYKVFCIDIDGDDSEVEDASNLIASSSWLHSSSACDDIHDICPFGYGIRADGKILTGARADEWLAREVNEE